MRKILSVLVLLAFSAAAQAELYKWTDSSGKVHYSDQPPPGVKTQKVEGSKAKSPAAAPDKASSKSLSDKELEFKKRRTESKEAATKKSEETAAAKEKEENCTQARSTLQTLQTGGRVATTDEKGERVFMDEAARQKAIEQAQKSVDSWCK